MTQQQIDRVEEIRSNAESKHLYSLDTQKNSGMLECCEGLLEIIDQLRAEPTLLERLLKAGYAFGGVDEYTGKHETYYYADDDEWFVRRAGIGGSQNDKVFPDFASLSQHLSQLLEKEV